LKIDPAFNKIKIHFLIKLTTVDKCEQDVDKPKRIVHDRH